MPTPSRSRKPVPVAAAPAPDPAPMQPPPSPPTTARDTSTAELLILVGVVIGFVMSGLFVLAMLGMSALVGGLGRFPMGGMMFGLLGLFGIVAFVLYFIALQARNEIRQGNIDGGSVKAIVLGAILLVVGGFVSGVLILVGGILARQATPKAI